MKKNRQKGTTERGGERANFRIQKKKIINNF